MLAVTDGLRLRDADVTVALKRVVAHASRHVGGAQARRAVDDPIDDVIVLGVPPFARFSDVTSGLLQAPAPDVPRLRVEVAEDLVGSVRTISLSQNGRKKVLECLEGPGFEARQSKNLK